MAGAVVLRDKITELLAPIVEDAGLDLETVEVTPAGRRRRVRVIVDADGGVDLDALADTSRAAAATLDSASFMGAGSYTLEVSSRGVDRPLTAPRHWRRNVGRLVAVTTVDGERVTGRIQSADDAGADLAMVEPGGRPDDSGASDRHVRYEAVDKARIEVEFTSGSAGSSDEAADTDDEGEV